MLVRRTENARRHPREKATPSARTTTTIGRWPNSPAEQQRRHARPSALVVDVVLLVRRHVVTGQETIRVVPVELSLRLAQQQRYALGPQTFLHLQTIACPRPKPDKRSTECPVNAEEHFLLTRFICARCRRRFVGNRNGHFLVYPPAATTAATTTRQQTSIRRTSIAPTSVVHCFFGRRETRRFRSEVRNWGTDGRRTRCHGPDDYVYRRRESVVPIL